MIKFTTAPVDQVVPTRRTQRSSTRAQVRQQYQDALEHALDSGEALVVELESEDNPLTIRNRIKRAAEQLEIAHLVIYRRGQRIVAYQSFPDSGKQAGDGSPVVLQEEEVTFPVAREWATGNRNPNSPR